MSGVPRPQSANRFWPTVIVVAFIASYLLVGWLTLDETTRFVPLLAAGVTLLLALADTARVLLGRGGGEGSLAEGGGVATEGVTAGRELAAIGLVAAGVAGVYLVGFHVAIPLYLFVSMAWLGAQPVRKALVVAAATSIAIFVVFELALAYNLYRGILFH